MILTSMFILPQGTSSVFVIIHSNQLYGKRVCFLSVKKLHSYLSGVSLNRVFFIIIIMILCNEFVPCKTKTE